MVTIILMLLNSAKCFVHNDTLLLGVSQIDHSQWKKM
jgi:hypothetical protein